MSKGKYAVTLETLKSINHLPGDIERGVKLYREGGIEIGEWEPDYYMLRVPHKDVPKTVAVKFTSNGQALEHFTCSCTLHYNTPPLCCHVVAAVLAIQGGWEQVWNTY